MAFRDRATGRGPSGTRWLFAFLAVAGILAGCGAEAPDYALRVGPTGYTEQELGVLGPEQMELLADLTAFGLAVSGQRIDELARPFVEAEQRALLLQKLATEVALRESGTDEARLRRLYEQNPEYELVVRHLVIISERWRSQEHRDAAREAAGEALARIRAGEDFGAVAAAVSDEPGAAERGGLLQPARRGDWVPEFWTAASRLEEGEVSGVVETEYGFHVIKLEERRVVPFEEVRSSVLTRLVDLQESLEQARAWADRQAAEMELHPEAIAEWRAGGPDALSLATWPGDGAYTGQELARYLLTLSDEERQRVEGSGPDGYTRIVAAAARNDLLADRARDAGIELATPERVAAERRWRTQVQGWADALGFAPFQAPADVRSAALAALASRQQSVQIIRGRVDDLGAALRALYPVSMPGDG